MSTRSEGFVLTSSPHAFSDASVPKIMYVVVVALVPAMIGSVLFFGIRVLMLYVIGAVTCLATEGLTRLARRKSWKTIYDGSALLTALLLVMTLPPTISPLLVIIGSVVSILVGKEIFGGLGMNVFNPALVGRAFLAAAYPVAITTWQQPNDVFGFLPDAASSATPLAAARFEGVREPLLNSFFGQIQGCIGETSTLFLLIGAVLLLAVGVIPWRQVTAYLGTVFILTGVFYLIDPVAYAPPWYHLVTGGLMMGALYMATDMVTSPYTRTGHVIFGAGAGLLVVIIRLFGGFPEGVMYSILLMNAVTPIINRSINTKTFGKQEAGE
jgi:electron transport complex protein RnfD